MALRYYNNRDLAHAWSGDVWPFIDLLAEAFAAYENGDICLPEKTSQILNPEDQSRINCMPCTSLDLGYSGVKLVSVFPSNVQNGKPNVSGLILMLNAEDGMPCAVLDAGFITALRTALVGGLGAQYLSISKPQMIGLLGAGEEALMHLVVMAKLFPSIQMCKVASRSLASERRLYATSQTLLPSMSVECCGSNYSMAAQDADIIVTAISGQSPVLKANWIKPGAFYCHVGGIEDEDAVALKANKIVCDSWEALKHRGSPTISHMYRKGLLTDDSIYAELGELVAGKKNGRESDKEFIYFNSIGLAFTDLYVSAALIDRCLKLGLGQEMSYSPFSAFDLGKVL